jgi:hypothetical protein
MQTVHPHPGDRDHAGGQPGQGGSSVTLQGSKKRAAQSAAEVWGEAERGRIADPPILTSGQCNPAHRHALI